jgi:hypothetical protein
MTGWSIARAVIAAALVSVAATPVLAQADDPPPQSDQGYQNNDSDQNRSGEGGFASRDATPPDSSSASPPEDENTVGSTWRSAPPPSGDAPTDDNSLDANPQQAPGTINSFTQPDPTPGFQATTGIDNRNQAVSSCLAAVRDRVRGGAGASRVDGIRGEWMVSGAIDDGRAFYCSIHAGAIADIELGS